MIYFTNLSVRSITGKKYFSIIAYSYVCMFISLTQAMLYKPVKNLINTSVTDMNKDWFHILYANHERGTCLYKPKYSKSYLYKVYTRYKNQHHSYPTA